MTAKRLYGGLMLPAVIAVFAVLAVTTSASAAAPVKEVLASQIGSHVDETKVQAVEALEAKGGKPTAKEREEENICTVASKDECQPAQPGSEADGFEFPDGVAANTSTGNVYVADTLHARVEQLTATGQFLSAFGSSGSGPGQFGVDTVDAVDQESGDLYVSDDVSGANNTVGHRVQKFTPSGQFVLEIGRKVNETKGTNLCTQEEVEKEAVKCTGPTLEPVGAGAAEPGAFANRVNGMAVGPNGVLYVASDSRIQEFEADGKYIRTIPLSFVPGSIAVDGSAVMYVTAEAPPSGPDPHVYRFATVGEPLPPLEVTVASASGRPLIRSIAVDASGRLAVAGREVNSDTGVPLATFGQLLDSASGVLITEFELPSGISNVPLALTFGANDGLYSVIEHEVVAYDALPVAELVSEPSSCMASGERESSALFTCDLTGQVNPFGVPETEVWFESGRTQALGSLTAKTPVATGSVLVPAHATVEGIPPNRTLFYRLAGFDQNVKPPERPLAGKTVSLLTGTVPPRVIGAPSVSFVGPGSALAFGELNPENASSTYEFQYAPAETCASLQQGCGSSAETPGAVSAAYGKIGVGGELSGLRPGTTYRYRLFAANQKGEPAVAESGEGTPPEAIFTTAAAPVPAALTGGADGVGQTSALITGAVNPSGKPATYTFQLAIYNGAATQYGVVASGTVGPSAEFVPEQAALSGLQPGTTYAYRITVKSGYIDNAAGETAGETATFTTAGLPSVLISSPPLAMLAVPNIAFPTPAAPSKPAVKPLTNAQKLARALKACKKKKSKKQRAACSRKAHGQYANPRQAKHSKKG